jgi:hypothetical protein
MKIERNIKGNKWLFIFIAYNLDDKTRNTKLELVF